MEITFVVTKDCQLACKYCYQVGKNSEERMSWKVAKSAIDDILSSEFDDFFATEAVCFNIIGGEPLLEIDLVEKICDYIEERMVIMDHHWKDHYSFLLTTNGINYHSPKVQEFIKKHKEHLYVSITLDGTREKHDLNRIWKNGGGRGSYIDVVKNIPLWKEQFPRTSTKVTVSSDDIPYICESVLHIFSLGIRDIYINCVFEDVWKEGDDLLLEKQLCQLGDRLLSTGLYKDHTCTFFDRRIGHPMDHGNDSNWCGAGRMLAVDNKGNYYPCLRFAKYSLRDKPERTIGNIGIGIQKNLVRPFLGLSRSIQSPKKCLECDVASGCAWCQGENYDCSESGTIFHRSTSLCKMHKARVRANRYYWSKLDALKGKRDDSQALQVDMTLTIDKSVGQPENIIVMLASDSTRFCLSAGNKKSQLIPIRTLQKAVEKAKEGKWHLQFMHPEYDLPKEYYELIDSVPHYDIVPGMSKRSGDAVVIKSWDKGDLMTVPGNFHIVMSTLDDFYRNLDSLQKLICHTDRLNIVFTDESSFSVESCEVYKETLRRLSELVLKEWKSGHKVNVNIITDRLGLDTMSNCDAGWKSLTLAPNGKFYICPAFYDEDESDDCGDIETGMAIKDPLLFKLDHSPFCKECKAYHCPRCVYLNRQKTSEVNVPSYEQCKKAEIELEISLDFYRKYSSRRP